MNQYIQILECQNIQIKGNHRTSLILINVYIPIIEKREQVEMAIITFLQANTKAHKQYEIIIGGDFNCKPNSRIINNICKYNNLKVIEG